MNGTSPNRAEVIQLSPRRMQCSSCGASANAACDCGVAYLPAGERAAAAVAANPAMSDRAIAAEIGVDHKTVATAHRAGGERSPPDKRTGRDGKSYPSRRQTDDEEISPAEDAKSALMALELRVQEALVMADSCLVVLPRIKRTKLKAELANIRATAAAWAQVAETAADA